MSTRWYYRLRDQEIGPVDFATLQLLAAEQRLSCDDQLRSDGSDEWVVAGSLPGLFADAATPDDLDSLLGNEASDGPDSAGAPVTPADLSAMLADAAAAPPHDIATPAAFDALAAMLATDAPSSRGAQSGWRDACYCRTRTDELGPMPFDQLVELARNGGLAPRDQVRLGHHAEWFEARSIVGLFAPGEMDQAPPVEAGLLDEFEIVSDPGAVQRPPQPSRATASKSEPAADAERTWYCRVLGQEIGPVGMEDLRSLVASKQLGPTDKVRQGVDAEWVAARTVAGLFPKRSRWRPAISEADVLDILQPQEDGDTTAAHVAPQRLARGGRHPAPAARDSQDASQLACDPATTTAPGPAASGAAEASVPARSASAGKPPWEMPTAPRPLPLPSQPRRSLGHPFSGLGGAIGALLSRLKPGGVSLGGLKSHWKPLAAVVVLLVVAAVIYGGLPFSGPDARKYYVETDVIWRQANLIKNTGTPQDWTAFCDRVKPRVTELSAELQQIAGSHNRLLQLMLFCHRDCLPKILAAPPDSDSANWKEMKKYMDEAERIFRENP